MVAVSVGNATMEITDSHVYTFLEFVAPNDREFSSMLKNVLLRAPYGSRARETAQLFQRFIEDSKSRNEPVLIDGVPIEKYLADARKMLGQ